MPSHRIAPGAPEIRVADVDGGNAMPLTSFGGPASGTARRSPGGRLIAFDSRSDGNVDIDIFVAPLAEARSGS